MRETRVFDLSDVLTVSTGRLLSVRGMEGVYDSIGFLLDDPGVTTIGLAMTAERCKAEVLAQHPGLAAINDRLDAVDLCDAETRAAWLADLRRQHGDTLTLSPIANSEGAPSLDAQVAHVLALNPSAHFLTVATPTPEERPDGQ